MIKQETIHIITVMFNDGKANDVRHAIIDAGFKDNIKIKFLSKDNAAIYYLDIEKMQIDAYDSGQGPTINRNEVEHMRIKIDDSMTKRKIKNELQDAVILSKLTI